MPLPNLEQIQSSLVKVVGFALTYALGRGWIASDQVAPLSALAVALAGVVYSFYTNRDAAKINAAAKVEEVKASALTPDGLKMACASPTIEVTSS